ncbi:MAG: HIT family protein [Alphaproteobacteria bacterium]
MLSTLCFSRRLVVKKAMFVIDPAFEVGSAAVVEAPLSHIRLQLDLRWPWLILIPKQPALREIEDLSPADQAQLMREIVACGPAVRAVGQVLGLAVEKLNIGALGNLTPQLHVHMVGRRSGDAAWPGPVWGVGVAEPMTQDQISKAIRAAEGALAF